MKYRVTHGLSILTAALVLLLLVADQPSWAQPAGMGMGGAPKGPTLASASIDEALPAGSVLVTVVAGSLDKPLANVSVTLLTDGAPVARSDANGKVTFKGVSGDRLQVSAKVDGITLKSEIFSVSRASGVTVVLTTKPIGPGRGGRPSTRMMSGRARPEQNDPAGQLTIRAIAGELEQSKFGGLRADIPTGAIIQMVGLHADGTMEVNSQKVLEEKEGRVTYDELVSDNSVAYYAMTIFERAGGSDRLMAEVLRMPPRVGSRMMFAGAPTKSASAGIDDLGKLAGTGDVMPEPGIVNVQIFAEQSQSLYFQNSSEVQLLQIAGDQSSVRAPVTGAPPPSSAVVGQAGTMGELPATAAGVVSFYAARPSTKSDLAGVIIRIERAEPSPTLPNGSSKTAEKSRGKDGGGDVATAVKVVTTVKTSAKGLAYARGLDPSLRYVAVATLHGVEARTEAFSPAANKPVSFAFAFEWPEQPARQAHFEGVLSGPTNVYIAKVSAKGRDFYSIPFQLTKQSGATVAIYMFPTLLFSMHGGGELDDNKVWFQSRFSIANPGVLPYASSQSGTIIPLPKGFLGASVADEMTFRVGVESDKGYVWRGAVPPGQRDFIGSFALEVSDGTIRFDMALPYGLRGGRMVVEDLPGLELRTSPGAKVESMVQPNGKKFLQMPEIELEPGQKLVFAMRGLPQRSVWQSRFQVIVGIVALVFIAWGVFTVFLGRKSIEQADPVLVRLETSREQLMNQLVKLETERRHKKRGRAGEKDSNEKLAEDVAYRKHRDKLSAKLEAMYREIDEHKAADTPA